MKTPVCTEHFHSLRLQVDEDEVADVAQRAAETVARDRASITDFQGALSWEVARQITEHVREVRRFLRVLLESRPYSVLNFFQSFAFTVFRISQLLTQYTISLGNARIYSPVRACVRACGT